MPRVYIGIGSNIDPESNIPAALRMLGEAVKIVRISTFYRTPSLGSPGSPEFYNGVVAVETSIAPRELKFAVLRRIEESLGRVRGPDKFAPRPIDLDIIVYGDLQVDEVDLVIPDPEITKRAFIAVPLVDLDPAMTLPGSGVRIADLAGRMDIGGMTALEDFTERLRQGLELS
jgi:2-amino-4-hydroxy-6-hydroxymethyldihydropteridine diphosphokinase